MLTLNSQISEISGVGPAIASRLKKLGLENISELLFYYPFRYDKYGATQAINQLPINEPVNIIAEIELLQNKRSHFRKMSLTEAVVKDETGYLKIIWFNQPYISKTLKVGDTISLAGKLSDNRGQVAMISPVYEKLTSQRDLIHTQGIVPVYSTTSSLTPKQLRFFISQALPLAKNIADWLPIDIKKRLKLLSLPEALKRIHFPENEAELLSAKQRLSFEELFLRQLISQIIKKDNSQATAPIIKFKESAIKNFVTSLPFTLTNDQKKSAWEIIQDLENTKPMSRILEGDVGSGKTLVATLALLNTALNKFQGILMAPTEILASQHFQTLSKFLKDEPIKIGLITRSQKKIYPPSDKKLKLSGPDIALEADIIIGTQALIQDKINFKNPGLIIVDEQHRFGVRQRQKLLQFKKSSGNQNTPHFLSMTATPIPRSLALAIYGDLNISLIKEKPKDRQIILTKIIPENNRRMAYDFIKKEIRNGRQAFVVCPLIDPSDTSGIKSVTSEFEYLDKHVFPDLKIGLLHGKLKSPEKEKIMSEFLANKINILISTSVIEVGVDIPNATIMMIEGAERFGLAQLHQFRGRVGRGSEKSYCFLFASSSLPSAKSLSRLNALVKFQDGFELAKEDLKLRGSGEIYGTIQSGFPELKIASLFDLPLIQQAQNEAINLINSDPELKNHPLLKEKLGEFERNIHLE